MISASVNINKFSPGSVEFFMEVGGGRGGVGGGGRVDGGSYYLFISGKCKVSKSDSVLDFDLIIYRRLHISDDIPRRNLDYVLYW